MTAKRRRLQWLAAASLIGPACSSPAAHRGSTDRSASTPPEVGPAGPEVTAVTPTTATSSGPATTSAGGAVGEQRAPAGPTTTLVVTTTSPLVVTPTTVRMPLPEDDGAGQQAQASWYAEGLPDPSALTFAHLTMPFGTRVLFKGPLGSVVATCTDRGPFVPGRAFDLSRGAFAAIAQLSAGVITVTWEVVG